VTTGRPVDSEIGLTGLTEIVLKINLKIKARRRTYVGGRARTSRDEWLTCDWSSV